MTPLTRIREAIPLTSAGAILLALAAAAFWFQGVGRLDLVLLSGSVLSVVLLAGLALATLAAAVLLRRKGGRGGTSLDLECGAWSGTGYGFPGMRWVPFLRIQVGWMEPHGVEADLASGLERVRPGRRALAGRVVRRVRVGDVLGLTECGWTEAREARVRILPARARLDPGAAFQGLVRGEEEPDPRGEPAGDRVDIRKYGHGDPMRMILWKVYARTRRVFVRIPERAVEPAPRVCLFLPVSPQDGLDEPPARLARTLLERGLLGSGWRFGADGAEDAATLPEALEALARSGSAARGGTLGAFLERARRDGFGACILLLPGRRGPWMEEVLGAVATSPLRIQAVHALDGWAPERPSWWRRALLAPGLGGTSPGEVLELVERMALPHVTAALVETRSGEVLPDPGAYLRKRAGRAA